MSVSGRTAVIGVGLLVMAALSACSGGGAEPTNPQEDATRTEASQSGPEISDPKDAAAVDVCQLLPAEGAAALGFEAQGVEKGNELDPDAPMGCYWKSPDGKSSVMLTAFNDRSIQEYHSNKSKYTDFQELTIAGHPVVRANQDDPMQVGYCDFFLATKDNQILAAQASQSSMTDPCGLAKKALEASVPTLPSAN